jgi:hypothetical protein
MFFSYFCNDACSLAFELILVNSVWMTVRLRIEINLLEGHNYVSILD